MKAFETAYNHARAAGEMARCIDPRAAAVETLMFFAGSMRVWLLDNRRAGLRKDARAAIVTHVRCRAVR